MREPGFGTRDVVWAALEGGSTETAKQVVAAGLGVVVSAAAAMDQLALALWSRYMRGFAVGRTLTRLSLPDRRPSAAAAAFDALLDRSA